MTAVAIGTALVLLSIVGLAVAFVLFETLPRNAKNARSAATTNMLVAAALAALALIQLGKVDA